MRKAILGAVGASMMLAGCNTLGVPGGYGTNYGQYDYNQPDPAYGGYYADRYYRPGQSDYVLNSNDRIYRGQDGQYYCRRSDGTTGRIIGGLAGGVLGSVLAPGGSSILGAVLGGAAGAVAGGEIDKNRQVRCR